MMESIFKWVHLSDLHFQSKGIIDEDFNSAELKEKLPVFLSSIKDVNAIIISGDFRYAPSKEKNPKNVADYIIEIAECLNVDISKVFLVPGNHDLDRGTIRNDIISGLRESYTPQQGIFDLERLHMLKKDFSFFDKLRELVYGENAVDDENPHQCAILETCNLLLLNTAIAAGQCDHDGIAKDEHNLLLGTQYLRAAVSKIKNDNPIIAVGHHGIEFLRDDEKKACSTYFTENGINLYLCGHTHELWHDSFGEKGKEITVGCLMQNNQAVEAGFSVGQIMSDGTTKVCCYQWNSKRQNWFEHSPEEQHYEQLFSVPPKLPEEAIVSPGTISAYKLDDQKYNPFSLKGYMLLGGRGIDGIKYIWEKDGHYVESLAFNKRLKDSLDEENSKISAYTCSVSFGCSLSVNNKQCLFCESGKIPYNGNLSAEDIALQNIFMAEYDSDCPSYPQVREHKREFAFMGQGEPGLCYPSVRRSILLTDHAMASIGQDVYRYIISTSGVGDFVSVLINDIKSSVFKNRITLHFSLHAIDDDRNILMPVNMDYDYKRFIRDCERFNAETGEKVGVGILMFNNYHMSSESGKGKQFTLTLSRLEKMLKPLNKDVFRIDLCDVNRTTGWDQRALSNEVANVFLELVKNKGFEGKLFSSFGDNQRSGCGMLSSYIDDIVPIGSTTIKHFNSALDLLKQAVIDIDG